jgi:hypothetical protein
MIILRYSYDNFVTEEIALLYRLIILYFYEYFGLRVKIMSLDGTTHCLLCGKRTENLLILSTFLRTVNELMEKVTANVTSWTMFF